MSSGCGDVLSLTDLQTAKKHQLFEAEVITGKQGGVASGVDIDYATNQATGQVQKTLPAVLRDAGFRPASFTFATGGTLGVNDADLSVLWPGPSGDGMYYVWHGDLPKVIPAGSTPASTGGVSPTAWVPISDRMLQESLAQSDGYKYLGEVQSFAALRALVPTAAGIRVKLRGWYSGSTLGGGEFISVSGSATDDGGVIASVNASWHWVRDIDNYLSPEMFGAKGDNSTDDSTALNNCFNASSIHGYPVDGGRRVTYVCSAPVVAPPYTKINGNGLLSIRRSSGVDSLVDFFTIQHDSFVSGISVLGNRSSSQTPAEAVLVRIASNVTFIKSFVDGSRGYGIVANTANGIRIEDVYFTDTGLAAIALYGDGTLNSSDFIISKCNFRGIGGGAISVQRFKYGLIEGCDISGTYLGAPNNRLYVATNVNGAVTWVAGPNFSTLKPGMFLVLPGGTEHRISAVSSSTNMTVDPVPPTTSAQLRAIAGSGDLIGIQECEFVRVRGNILSGGVTYGTGGGTMAGSTHGCNYCEWSDNIISNTGKNGINLSQSGAAVSNCTISNNKLTLTGSGGTGSSASYLLPDFDTAAIGMTQGNSNLLTNTRIYGNECITFTADLGAGVAWLYLSGMSQGTVTANDNAQYGYADGYIRGDILNINLTGYGTGASATNFLSAGDRVVVRIQTGTSPTASPYFTVTKVIRSSTEPVLMAQVATTTGTVAFCWGLQTSTASVWSVGQNATPSGNITYHIRG